MKESSATTSTQQSSLTAATPRSAIVASAALALAIGTFVLFGVGFAQPELLHNAAHDTRHAFTFPCH